MPGGFTDIQDICHALSAGEQPATSLGATITANASNNTKGSYTQLIAATASDCSLLQICLYYDGSNFGGGIQVNSVDIAIGVSGSEVVLIPDLVITSGYVCSSSVIIIVPVQILAGTRISARCQSTTGSIPVNVKVNTFDAGFTQGEGYSGVSALGFNAGSTLGTAVAPSGTANTLGSYAPIISSTTRDYFGFFAMLDTQTNDSQSTMLIDFAIGVSGSEVVILPSIPMALNPANGADKNCGPGLIPFIPLRIPAGTRISARTQSSIAAGTTIGATVYGVY